MKIKPLIEEEQPKNEIVSLNKTFLKLPKTRQEMITSAAIAYEAINQQEKLLNARRTKEVRPIVEGAVEAYGIEDSEGHMHLVMDDVEVIHTKKVSRTLNSIAAEELLKEKGLYDSCVMQVISWEIDEEAVIEAYNAGKISAAELDDIFNEKISWALSVKTDVEEVAEIRKLRKEIEKSKPKELPEIESE